MSRPRRTSSTRSPSPAPAQPSAAPRAARAPRHEAAVLLGLLALTVAALGVDSWRVGFFADDFHFLDVARRVPLPVALLGQYGIWPWLRPLSRELYFAAIVASGHGGLAVAHALNLAAAFGCAVLTWRVGRRLLGANAAAIASALFLAYGFSRFLVAWASGFQDMLALLLVLASLDALLSGRRSLALLWAALAPFAKESAFVVFPLLAAFALASGMRQSARGWYARLAGVFGVALAIHVVARLTWHSEGATPRAALDAARLPNMFAQVLGGFVTLPHAPGPVAIALGIAAGVAAAALLWGASTPASEDGAPAAPVARAPMLVVLAAVLGIAPAVAGHLVFLTFGHAYHAFPAVPWIALLIGAGIARLPRRAWLAAVPLLVAVDVCGLEYRVPDLDRAGSWGSSRWDWPAAVRIDAIARRFTADVRAELRERPDSVVVLFEGVPLGSFFQTEDGPAVREALRDPRARGYWINDPPAGLQGRNLAILSFDAGTMHLRRARWSTATAILRATNAVVARRANAADAFAQAGAAPDSAREERAYLRAAAALLARGPGAFASALAGAGLADSLAPASAPRAAIVAAWPAVTADACERMWRRPLSADAHAALAESLLAHGATERGALELRVATQLSPQRWRDRYHLACVMVELGGVTEALVDLREIAASPDAGSFAAIARGAAAQVERDFVN